MSIQGISFRIALGLCLVCALVLDAARASPQERPRDKDFGSSLKRLKWDEGKKAATEPKRGRGKEKRAEEDEEVVRVETSLVVFDCLVLDRRGHTVQGLTRDDFVVSENEQPQQLGTFARGDDAMLPRSIVLIIDHSFAQVGFIKSSIEAARTLVEQLAPRDRMAIVTDEVKLLTDFTQDKARLKGLLDSLSRESESRARLFPPRFNRGAHYSALLAALKELFGDGDLRPIVIFQAHGNEAVLFQQPIGMNVPTTLRPDEQEEARTWILKWQQYLRPHLREFSLNDVYATAEKSRATIYGIIPGYRLVGLSPDERVERMKNWEERFTSEWAKAKPGGAGPREFRGKKHWELVWNAEGVLDQQTALVGLAKLTGGWADFLEEPSQAAAIYSRILSDVNSRYVIGFYPFNKARDGKRREVKIEVRGHPEYTVWGRKSYYAPGEPP